MRRRRTLTAAAGSALIAVMVSGCGPDDAGVDLSQLDLSAIGVNTSVLESVDTVAAVKLVCKAGSIWTAADSTQRGTLATTVHQLVDRYRTDSDSTLAAAATALATVVDAGDSVTQASMDAFNSYCTS